MSVPASVKLALDAWCREQTLALREAMPDAGNRETRVSMSEVVERLIVEHLERVKGKR